MSEATQQDKTSLVVPPSIVTRVDVSRLVSEMEQLDNDFTAHAARAAAGADAGDEPKPSQQLEDFLTANNLELGDDSGRSRIIKQLRDLKGHAPTIHVTFATSADNESLQQLVVWLRQSVHPHALLVVGIQPSLIGGVYVRTANQVYDFSLRAQLEGHRDSIVKELEALRGGN